jgi:hypothetical protein
VSDQPLGYESRTRPAPKWPRFWPRNTVARWTIGVFLVLLLAFMLLPSLNRPRINYSHMKCNSNLRQIGLAIQMYANDNRGRLPPDLATVMVAEDLTSEVFTCPSTNDERATGPTTQAVLQEFAKPGHCSYTLASPLPQILNALTPAHVLAYEATGNHLGQGTNILFGDGRCEWMPDAKAAYFITELKAGFNPPRKPK